MKTIIDTTKRKKIRTRKSLNEIRNRSRRLFHPESKPTRASDDMGNNQKRNHFVTSNRLTLEMFPNAVQSETVTRYGNDEVKKKLILNFKDILHDRNDCTKNVSEVVGECSNSDNSIQSISDGNDVDHKSDRNSDSPELQSPDVVGSIQREEFSLQSGLHNTLASTQLTGVTSRAHHTHEKYYIYEEFMSEISVYIKQTVTKSLLSDNIVERLKSHLFAMRLQSKDSATNLKHKPALSVMRDVHITGATQDMVVEDPMDYIRFSYSAMHNTPNYQSECHTNSSESVGSMLEIHSVLSSSSRTGLSDTPEYIYFPHKLN